MEKIKASLVLEMLGRPAEHIKETMKKLIERIDSGTSIKVLSRKIAEPKKIEEIKQEMYSTFAEVEIEIDSLHNLFLVVFTYLPSHIEIISPTELKFRNIEVNSLLNELAIKLHKYDEVAKRLNIERQVLYNQLAKMKQQTEQQESVKKKKNKNKAKKAQKKKIRKTKKK